MDISVRSSVEPLNTALGGSPTIFLQGSFVGLPLINQALAAENPLGGGSFFVTVRALIKVLGEIPPAAVVQALTAQNAPHTPAHQTPPPEHQTPLPGSPPAATCGAELDLDNPSFGGFTNMRIFGGGFQPSEVVDIIDQGGQVAASTQADTFGGYSVHLSVPHGLFPTPHTVHAHGESSGRTSNDAGFTV
jgi:hypothetical protein